jgi:PAS domain S-box-containing protein
MWMNGLLIPRPRPMNTGLTSVVLRTGKALLVGGEVRNARKKVQGGVVIEGWKTRTYVECGDRRQSGWACRCSSKAIPLEWWRSRITKMNWPTASPKNRILTFVAGQIALAMERKRVAEAQRKSEEKFRALFEASSQGIMLHDEKEYLEVNPAAARILGYSNHRTCSASIPVTPLRLYQPNGESSDVLAENTFQECLTKRSARFEWTGRTAQGRDIPLRLISPGLNGAGAISSRPLSLILPIAKTRNWNS